MTQYTAPLRDMNFVLNELAGLAHVAKLPGFEDAGPETVEAILDEAAKFASQVLAPINAEGDAVGCTWKDGEVTTPPGFKQAYAQFVAGGGMASTPRSTSEVRDCRSWLPVRCRK